MSKTTALELLTQKIQNELVCELKSDNNRLVFGKGNIDASIFFIGEAPGKKEAELGIPFVGSAGKILDELLNSINLSIDDVYIANILKYRPPNNRDPLFSEIKLHTPYLLEQIKIIKPKVICTLGNYATKFVLANFIPEKMEKILGISHLHGKEYEIMMNGEKLKVIPLYHPAASLYTPSLKQTLFEDFKIIGNSIKL